MLPFTTLDVFTDTPFKGNPLAVVTIPRGVILTQAQKQLIAKEFNLSETVFVHDVADPAATSERRFDIFTPRTEIPFAGHPTIGTSVHLLSQGVRTLVAKAGPITIQPVADDAVRTAIPHNVRLHQRRLPSPDPSSFAPFQAEVVEAERGAPLFSIVKGMTFALIELPSLDVLAAVRPGAPDLAADLLDEDWRDGWETRRYYFVRLGSSDVDGRPVHKLRTRMVKLNMEDPATGSAACALSSYLSLHALEEQSSSFEIRQGVEIGRDSTLVVDTEVDSSSSGLRRLETLHLGGKAVPIISGSIRIPPDTRTMSQKRMNIKILGHNRFTFAKT